MSTAGIPVLGSVTLSGATNIQRKERDYIIEHQIAGKDGGLVERVGSASTRWEIKGFLREKDADSQYQSLIGLLGTTSNLSIPTFGSGYFLAASGTIVFVESFQGNWIPGVGYPRYDYTLKLVSTNKIQPAATTSLAASIVQQATHHATATLSNSAALAGALTIGNTIVAVATFFDGGIGTITAYTCTDNVGNTYTKQANTTDQSNGLGAVIFSAPITIGGASVTPNISISAGTIVNTTSDIAVYEVKNLASSTAVATNQQEGGGASFSTTTTGGITFSADVLNGSGGSLSFTGTSDITGSATSQIGHGSGTYTFSGSVTFNEMVEASFS